MTKKILCERVQIECVGWFEIWNRHLDQVDLFVYYFEMCCVCVVADWRLLAKLHLINWNAYNEFIMHCMTSVWAIYELSNISVEQQSCWPALWMICKCGKWTNGIKCPRIGKKSYEIKRNERRGEKRLKFQMGPIKRIPRIQFIKLDNCRDEIHDWNEATTFLGVLFCRCDLKHRSRAYFIINNAKQYKQWLHIIGAYY